MQLRITDLLDGYMDDALPLDPAPAVDSRQIKAAVMQRTRGTARRLRPLRMALVAAAVVAVLTGSALAVMRYSGITDDLERRWNSQGSAEMTSEQKDYIEARSASIGESAADQGVTVTIDSVTCTADTVYLQYKVELDPAVYDLEQIKLAHAVIPTIYVENDDFGCWSYIGGGGGAAMVNGVQWITEQISFDNLPEGANLGDGRTTLHIEIGTFELSGGENDLLEVTGTWRFSFLLPQSEAAEEKTSDDVITLTVDFDSGLTLAVSNISVDEAACSFTVASDTDDYYFTASGMDAALLWAAEPDAAVLTVDAVLEDGSVVPSGGGRMHYDEAADTTTCYVEWSAPLDPDQVVALSFSDGVQELQVPVA